MLKHWRGAVLIETASVLSLRNSPHLADPAAEEEDCLHDFAFPDKFSFDNPIVGFAHTGTNAGLNYILADGSTSDLPYNCREEASYRKELISPEGAVVRCVKMWGSAANRTLFGVMFFGGDGECLIRAGHCPNSTPLVTSKAVWPIVTREFTLGEGERILGVKSQKSPNSNYLPKQNDVVFVIGRLE